jgi:hypothetical protein
VTIAKPPVRSAADASAGGPCSLARRRGTGAKAPTSSPSGPTRTDRFCYGCRPEAKASHQRMFVVDGTESYPLEQRLADLGIYTPNMVITFWRHLERN